MKATADIIILLLVAFMILGIRRIYKFWFTSKPKAPVQTPEPDLSPRQINIQHNHNTVNILVVKDKRDVNPNIN